MQAIIIDDCVLKISYDIANALTNHFANVGSVLQKDIQQDSAVLQITGVWHYYRIRTHYKQGY